MKPFIQSIFDATGRPMNTVVHKTLNPLSPIALMDMEAKDRIKYGKLSAYYQTISSVKYDGQGKINYKQTLANA